MPPISRLSMLWLAPFLACLPAEVWADGNTVDYHRLGWQTRDEIKKLPVSQQPVIAPMCTGAWITPIPLGTRAVNTDTTPISAQAGVAHYDPQGRSLLTGSVVIRQGNRQVEADNAEIQQEAGTGTFSGNIMVAEPGMVMTGQKAYVDFGTRQARVERAEFVTTLINAHGRADQIVRNEDGNITIGRGEYSTCEPTHRSWYFVASNIHLDPESHRGEVHNATLYAHDIPVFYTPYFNFPLDDTRKSGLLIPRFGSTSDGGFDLALPVYLNLAPNYDATLTPRYISRRGTMAEGEFRYLLPWGGTGTLEGTELPNDTLFDNRDRKSLSWQHNGDLSKVLSVRTNINYVSDNAYFTDLGSNFTTANTTAEERTGELLYHRSYGSLLARVQSFQTIDPTLTDSQKPYASLPSLQMNLGRPTPEGWQPSLLADLTNFQRTINDGSGPEINGGRMRIEPNLQYAFNKPWGFVRPNARLHYLAYDLSGSGVSNGDANLSVTVPTLSLDSGLVFERSAGNYLQTLEPRAFYLYAPYRDQSALPVFDTTTSTFSYSQLFRDSRFSGGDRIDDANQLSLGATSRFIDPADGSEQFRASLGEIIYFRNRDITVPPPPPAVAPAPATARVSGLAAELAAQFNSGWSGTANVLQSPDGQHLNQFSIAATYMPPTRDRIWNISYNVRREDASLAQQSLRQTQVSIIQPLGVSWKVIGLWQYDVQQKQAVDLLGGVEYEACCWSVRFVRRQYLTAPTTVSDGTELKHSAFFMEIRLKGLAGLGSSIDSLLGKDVYGYTQLIQREDTH
jgi:LPS-assembly protein